MKAGQPGEGVSVAHAEFGGVGTMEHRVVVAADRAAVWRAYTTSDGLMGWAAPFVDADFRLDGAMESHYAPDARKGDGRNGIARFIAFVPGRMLAFRSERLPAGAPMDGGLWLGMHQVVELATLADGRTEVRQTVVGFGEGEGHRRIREFMGAGNAWVLGKLKEYVEGSPVDWPAEMAPRAAPRTAAPGEARP